MPTWNDKYLLGHAAIDRQHRDLIENIGSLQQALDKSTNRETLKKSAEKLLTCSLGHFNSEEFLMEQGEFPEKNEHIKEHELFVNRISHLKTACETGEEADGGEISSFLDRWLKTHILRTDRALVEYLLQKSKVLL